MNKKEKKEYNPEVELAKGAKLEAASYDKTQTVKVLTNKVTVGGQAGAVEFSGIATGRDDASINGCVGIWLSIFRYMRPDGSTDHVAGWNITLPLKSKQTPSQTATTFAKYINNGGRPYKAKAAKDAGRAFIKIFFTGSKIVRSINTIEQLEASIWDL